MKQNAQHQPHLVVLLDATYSIHDQRIEFRPLAMTSAADPMAACHRQDSFQSDGYAPVVAFNKKELLGLVRALRAAERPTARQREGQMELWNNFVGRVTPEVRGSTEEDDAVASGSDLRKSQQN